jgi:hypothetical protein
MPVFGRGKSMTPFSQSIAARGRVPQSAFPKPQLMPSRIWALTGTDAAASSLLISSAVNSLRPCRAFYRRRTFGEGRLKFCPYTTGSRINRLSAANLKDAADALDHAADGRRRPALRHVLALRREVLGAQVLDQAGLAEPGNEQVAGGLVIRPGAGQQFAAVHEGLLGVQECVGQLLDCQGLWCRLGLPPRVQGILLVEVFLQGALGVGPGAEVVQLAADLLRPDARGVREEGEIGVRLAGLTGSVGAVT